MIARMTWIPSGSEPETLIVDLPDFRYDEMRQLIGTPEWSASKMILWIPYRTGTDGTMTKGLFRLARITALDPEEPS